MKPMVGNILKAFDFLNNAVAIFLLITAVVVVFMAAASRYAFHSPIAWTEEIARFSFIWLAFAGVSIAERMNVHFQITFFIHKVPRTAQKYVWMIDEVIVLGILTVLFFDAIQFGQMGQKTLSAVFEMPLSYIYVALPTAVVLTFINRVRNAVIVLTGGREYFPMGEKD